MVKSGELRASPQMARACQAAEDSRALNAIRGACLIMAGNGLCTGGRIVARGGRSPSGSGAITGSRVPTSERHDRGV